MTCRAAVGGYPQVEVARIIRTAGVARRRLWQAWTVRHSTPTSLLVLVGVLALASVLGWWWKRSDGRIRPATPATGTAGSQGEPSPTLTALGVPAGAVTLVQFSSAVCAPCRATRRVLEDVQRQVDGLHLREVDAEQHLDAARELDIWRTPTVLVVDTGGQVVQRVSGVPDRQELIAALGPLLAGAGR
ncbi:thioredoxin family protein [Micromonospora sp. NPDC051925]|uniref:thioredoxin family protein n=1 Tax=Micromonospora sp. NPDC051925 TaxID=3364288 RepID=UPI0037C50BD7